MTNHYFASCPPHFEDILKHEADMAGCQNINIQLGGIGFSANKETAYSFLLSTRIANRLYCTIASGLAETRDQLYVSAKNINWEDHLLVSDSFNVSSTIAQSAFDHTKFPALVVKDAIADSFRELYDKRPSVGDESESVCIHVHIHRENATFSIDMAGTPLFKRGYRSLTGEAPIKENVAAALLYRSGWDREKITTLFDPMCGSGTIIIEAALMAKNIAPGILREYFSLFKWKQFDEKLWDKVMSRLKDQVIPLNRILIGADKSAELINSAKEICSKLELPEVQLVSMDTTSTKPEVLEAVESGMIISNPPYNKRLQIEAEKFFKKFGENLKENYQGWQASILFGEKSHSQYIGMKASKSNAVKNGDIDCLFCSYSIFSNSFRKQQDDFPLSDNAVMLENRLNKNIRQLKKWLQQEKISSYRIYDADIPEYNVAVDIYENKHIHVQEYAPPKDIDKSKALHRLNELTRVLSKVFTIDRAKISIRQRTKQSGKNQYSQLNESGKMFVIHEGGHSFYVNFSDYLDTGIFLDHRIVRSLIQEKAKNKRFCNLFAYTGSATIYAVKGGAKTTTTVDASKRYCEWAQDNFKLNKLSVSLNKVVQDDVFSFLTMNKEEFDLILLDPPTFSNSKSRDTVLDIQRDHEDLINKTMNHLSRDGELLFSTNKKGFSLSDDLNSKYIISSITDKTIPRDFSRKKIHSCFSIKHNPQKIKIKPQQT